MALQKQNLNLNFAQGLDTKTDPKQVRFGKFLRLVNSVFGTMGLLKKRNGFPALTAIPNTTSTSLTTFNDNLLAIGENVEAFAEDSNIWINSGTIQPISLSVLPLVRSSSSQTTVDTAISSGNLACSAWLDSDSNCYYQITDSVTGQIVVSRTQLPATAAMPRAFVLGRHFVITFLVTVSAATHLKYIAIPLLNPSNPGSPVDLITTAKNLSVGYDGYVANNNLYIACGGTSTTVKITYLDSTLVVHGIISLASSTADRMSVTADVSGGSPIIWITYWETSGNNAHSVAYSSSLVQILAPTQTITSTELVTLTSSANSGVLRLFYEVSNTYGFSPNAQTDYIETVACSQGGSVGSPTIILRGAGIFSKSFYLSSLNNTYLVASYGQAFQPTYYLIDQYGNIISKFAYSNGAGYPINQILPGVSISDSLVQFGYLIKDLLVPVNKEQGASNVAGIYSQTGINLISFDFINTSNSQEIGRNLNITGGITWAYDGVKPTEQGFNVWPEDLGATPQSSGGSMADQDYFYVQTYEWTDAQGNLFRSAPSVPLAAVVSGGSGSGSVDLDLVTLRQTYKITPNPVRIVLYRWSTAQQTYYQVTSISDPILNDPTVDSISYTDILADSSILGNVILYTTGGVVENISPPSFVDMALFKSRLIGIDSEDPNLLWYSKQVIEATPVEMSDLFTFYVAPSTGAQGSTGSMKCVFAMDDKAIIFKKDAIYYFTGTGPDNTGANNDFSEPIFITSTVGCENKKSIVMTPNGIMFQSDKGIWLLGRDLNTTYIGADVEEFNDNLVLSALTIPGTNEVRFTLDNGITLMYDYFYGQWGTFEGIPAISSTLYDGLHTYLNKFGQVFRENPGTYSDGSNPTLMSFTSSWINLAGLQGYQRAYYFYLLGQFLSPHKIQIQIAYDYAASPSQTFLITPDNYSAPYGGDAYYGSGSPYGGPSSLEQWRVFFQQQKCQSFKITFNEIYDASYAKSNGAGLTVSGLDIVFGIKKGWTIIKSKNSVG